jgi:hypothetical protein
MLVAEMVMPYSQNEIAVLRDNPQDIRKFAWIEAITVNHRYLWFNSDFCITTAAFDMNIWRFGRLPCIAEMLAMQELP